MTRQIFSSLVLVLMAIAAPVHAASTALWAVKVDPWVLQTAQEGETEFLVYLSEQADLSAAEALPTKAEKGAFVYRALTEMAARTQPPLLAALQGMGVEYRPLWVANMVWMRGDQAAIQAIAQRAEVARLYANPSVRMELPASAPAQPDDAQSPDTVEWNVRQINADDLWAAGYTGQGAVIGGQDTGYDWDHPALIDHYRGWNGTSADHSYNWHDAIHSGAGAPCPANSPEPCDGANPSHGTHTMGTMVGDDGAGHQIGVAPGARWIGCRNMNNSGAGTPETYSECYQWFIAPTDLSGLNPHTDLAPDVINNSWSCPFYEGCTDPQALLTVVNNVRAAGILTVHSAGNSGPFCESVDDPATIYEASFSVGATDDTDTLAGFSSRGPVTVDGSNRLKPNVSAPGVNVNSSLRGTGYGILGGTSMAAPHVAGLAALLISLNPSLGGQVEALEDLIEGSSDANVDVVDVEDCGGIPGTAIPNNNFGWGRVDALAAAQQTPHYLAVHKTASADWVLPSQPITYTLAVTHQHLSEIATNVILTDTLPLGTTFISATQLHSFDGTRLRWALANLAANEVVSVTLTVQAPASLGAVSNDLYSARSDQVTAPVTGPPVNTAVVTLSYLPLVPK